MRGLRIVLALTVWAALTASPWTGAARAADDKAKEHGAAAGKHDDHGSPVDKVMDFRFYWDSGLWSLIIFLVLLYILYKTAWPRMLEGMHKREMSIRGAIEEAQAARAEALKLREQFQKEMDGAAAKVREVMDEARRDAQKLHDDELAKGRAEAKAEYERAVRDIELTRQQALQDIGRYAVDLAAVMSEKAIRRKVTADDHRAFVEEAMAELKQGRGAPSQN
jgi:F-type H+-transporting ATPase subunit b